MSSAVLGFVSLGFHGHVGAGSWALRPLEWRCRGVRGVFGAICVWVGDEALGLWARYLCAFLVRACSGCGWGGIPARRELGCLGASMGWWGSRLGEISLGDSGDGALLGRGPSGVCGPLASRGPCALMHAGLAGFAPSGVRRGFERLGFVSLGVGVQRELGLDGVHGHGDFYRSGWCAWLCGSVPALVPSLLLCRPCHLGVGLSWLVSAPHGVTLSWGSGLAGFWCLGSWLLRGSSCVLRHQASIPLGLEGLSWTGTMETPFPRDGGRGRS